MRNMNKNIDLFIYLLKKFDWLLCINIGVPKNTLFIYIGEMTSKLENNWRFKKKIDCS